MVSKVIYSWLVIVHTAEADVLRCGSIYRNGG